MNYYKAVKWCSNSYDSDINFNINGHSYTIHIGHNINSNSYATHKEISKA